MGILFFLSYWQLSGYAAQMISNSSEGGGGGGGDEGREHEVGGGGELYSEFENLHRMEQSPYETNVSGKEIGMSVKAGIIVEDGCMLCE